MARTIRYATAARAADTGPTIQSRRGVDVKLDVDGYLERLAKYVPAEILAAFTPLAALMGDRPGSLLMVTVVCLVLVPVYLYITRVIQPRDTKPKFRRYMYVLAIPSFIVWALNTSEPFRTQVASLAEVKAVVSLDPAFASVLLVLTALIVPGIDIVLDYWLAGREGQDLAGIAPR